MDKPILSIIITVKPGDSVDKVLDSLARLDYPAERMEVLVAEGWQPSRQRNRALREARGDIVYFLDNDSVASPDLINQVIPYYSDGRVAGVGGPNLTPPHDSFLQKCFGYILSSPFGVFKIRYRYRPIGQATEADENMLILCNLSMRRSVLEREGAFNESLYPNEENELINRLRARNYKLIYNPKAIVYRSRRRTILQFCKQIATYGRGRMEQTLVAPVFFNWLRMGPLIFCLYLLALLFFRPDFPFFLPIFLYLAVAIIFSSIIAYKERKFIVLFALPLLFFLTHTSYGIGLFWGLIKKGFKLGRVPEAEVVIRHLIWENDSLQVASGLAHRTEP